MEQTFMSCFPLKQSSELGVQPPHPQAGLNALVTSCPDMSGNNIPSCNVPASYQLMSHPSVHHLQTVASRTIPGDLKAWLVSPN